MISKERKAEIVRQSYYRHHEKNKAKLRHRYHSDPERYKAENLAWRKANPEKAKLSQMRSFVKRKYGLTWEQYQHILRTQKVCTLCGRKPDGKGRNGRQLCVDHDHETGAFRAMLCRSCNSMIGLSGDSPEILRKAADYIDHHRRLRT